MLNQNHPDDERLSALAFDEADATADASLTSHVAACDRCTGLVRELGALRVSLAELPDVAPPRPLRLLPEVDPEPVGSGAVGWVRRFFAPVLTAGAALAIVGLVGTTAPALSGMASGGQSGAAPDDARVFEEVGNDLQAGGTAPSAAEFAPEESVSVAGGGDGAVLSASDDAREAVQDRVGEGDRSIESSDLPAERSPWPMVLFTGVTIMVGAALLRWILVPRAA